ncbi:hypothetical protein FB007_13227 [Sinorhizobium medicae]|nr:hypothetical protein FB007_13227 [Sinorhizobium medicae]
MTIGSCQSSSLSATAVYRIAEPALGPSLAAKQPSRALASDFGFPAEHDAV